MEWMDNSTDRTPEKVGAAAAWGFKYFGDAGINANTIFVSAVSNWSSKYVAGKIDKAVFDAVLKALVAEYHKYVTEAE